MVDQLPTDESMTLVREMKLSGEQVLLLASALSYIFKGGIDEAGLILEEAPDGVSEFNIFHGLFSRAGLIGQNELIGIFNNLGYRAKQLTDEQASALPAVKPVITLANVFDLAMAVNKQFGERYLDDTAIIREVLDRDGQGDNIFQLPIGVRINKKLLDH